MLKSYSTKLRDKVKEYTTAVIKGDDNLEMDKYGAYPSQNPLVFAYCKFIRENGYNVRIMNEAAACAKWLEGLPLPIDYAAADVAKRLQDWYEETPKEAAALSKKYGVAGSFSNFCELIAKEIVEAGQKAVDDGKIKIEKDERGIPVVVTESADADIRKVKKACNDAVDAAYAAERAVVATSSALADLRHVLTRLGLSSSSSGVMEVDKLDAQVDSLRRAAGKVTVTLAKLGDKIAANDIAKRN